MHKNLVIALAAASAAVGTLAVQAHEQGDIIIRAGIVTVAPDTSSDGISIPTVAELPGGVDVDNDTQLSIIGAWMMSDNWGLELLAATPFEHDIDLEDAPLNAGSTRHLPPTLSLQWYPRGGMPGWQPYIGAGVNWTIFFDEDIGGDLGGFLGSSALQVTDADLSLDDSVGVSFSAGVDVPINDKWMFNAGVWWIDIGTEADIDVVTGGGANATVSFDVDIDPWVYNIGFAYKF